MSSPQIPFVASEDDHSSAAFPFDNTYARLPERFYSRVTPIPVASPQLIQLNTALAEDLNLDLAALTPADAAQIFSGNRIASGSEPIALAYAGHQFGHFVPQLGDGRANLLGEVIARNGRRYDIQLKGSGATPFSRRGDGRAALGPVLREYLVSEAMHALGVPTTRALAAVTTGERVFRETIASGAIITRVAASHLRVGTFQYFAARNDLEGLRLLADYAIARHYPEAAESPTPYRSLLAGVVTRHAQLVAQWLLLGFIHGVMNTDNTSISGETLDYGPCAFLEAYDPAKVFSSIDHNGRYAYDNQPNAAHWNLARLAETLIPLLAQETGSDDNGVGAAHEALALFAPVFDAARLNGLRRKLGCVTAQDIDAALAEDLLSRMATNNADFTLSFSRLTASAADPANDAETRTLFTDPTAFDTWAKLWRLRLAQESDTAETRIAVMRQASPTFIPRNHLVQAAITAAEQQDFQPFEQLLEVVTHPFDDDPHRPYYTTPARPEQSVTQTFCGT